MAWATPFTWATGDPVTAGKLNQGIRDNARFLYGYGQEGWFEGRMAGLNLVPSSVNFYPLFGTVEFDPTGYLAYHLAGTALPWPGMPLPVGYHWCSVFMDTPVAAPVDVAVGITDDANITSIYWAGRVASGAASIGLTSAGLVNVTDSAAIGGTAGVSTAVYNLAVQQQCRGITAYINTRISAAQVRGY